MQNYMGKDGFNWFFGKVVDRQDPLCLGRMRVRIFGIHPDDENLVPDEHLPWAIPIQPITSAAMFGVGHSPTGAMQGTHVFGFFADGSDCQLPFILGTVASGLGHFILETTDTVGDTISTAGTALNRAAEKIAPGESSEITKKLPDSFVNKAVQIGPLLMRDLGIKDIHAAAILGNIYAESHMISDAREGLTRGPCWPKGTTRKGYGWAQWTGPRMDSFIEFCASNFNGYDIEKQAATDSMNYKYLIHELTGPYKSILTKAGGRSPVNWVGLINTNTVQDATRDFMNGFERPNAKVAHIDSRTNAAISALNAMRKASVPVNSTGKPKKS